MNQASQNIESLSRRPSSKVYSFTPCTIHWMNFVLYSIHSILLMKIAEVARYDRRRRHRDIPGKNRTFKYHLFFPSIFR